MLLEILLATALATVLFALSMVVMLKLARLPDDAARRWQVLALRAEAERDGVQDSLGRVREEYAAVAKACETLRDLLRGARSERDRLDWCRMVGDFHQKFGVTDRRGGGPGRPDGDSLALGMKLIREEYEELCEAVDGGDLPGVADGIADSIYVLIGLAHRCGIDLRPIFAAVHAANMAKTLPTPELLAAHAAAGKKVPAGKILKPDGWQPPDIEGLLWEQQQRFKPADLEAFRRDGREMPITPADTGALDAREPVGGVTRADAVQSDGGKAGVATLGFDGDRNVAVGRP